MRLLLQWPKLAISKIADEGWYYFFRSLKNHFVNLTFRMRNRLKRGKLQQELVDVIYVNGCHDSVPHPIRYRVDHQIQQLYSQGVFAEKLFYLDISLDDVRRARNFVFFRCPYTELVGEFIALAKKANKKVYFDIDDLVIDTIYTDKIKFLDTLNPSDRTLYDDGVRSMGKTLSLCDAAITTTEALAVELKKFVPEVFINRNIASEEMVFYSNKAVYRRDILPNLQKGQFATRDNKMHKKAVQEANLRKNKISIGYFSGSISHNDDFNLVLPAIVKILEDRPNVNLYVVGELDLPLELKKYSNRIVICPFTDWTDLPKLIAKVDINIAPLIETSFNSAKSEIKWLEAALVKVPTIASNVGAFAKMITNGVTGILCGEDADAWYKALTELIDNPQLRVTLANNAYEFCQENCTSVHTGYHLANYFKEHQTENIMFVVPSLQTSGGILVILKHCAILQKAGYDVTILNVDDSKRWINIDCCQIPVFNRDAKSLLVEQSPVIASIDKAVATHWATMHYLRHYPNLLRTYYFVQGFEPDFFEPTDIQRLWANATYSNSATYITMSKWCKEWLDKEHHKNARLVSNGLKLRYFTNTERMFTGKIRILIEGDSASIHKNVDEAFRIADALDPSKFEIWYLSYKSSPKPYYRVDKSFTQVPHDKVGSIYGSCHILLKTSTLESFSYPPLEMMATGGYVVALPNQGNISYLVNGKNCLLYQKGDISQAVKAIEKICFDANLREILDNGARETVNAFDWDNLSAQIVEAYK